VRIVHREVFFSYKYKYSQTETQSLLLHLSRMIPNLKVFHNMEF
jgi:hypothetical protein